MSTRKYLSEYEKLLKKRKIEKQIESQKGSMDKFVTNIKKNTIERLSGLAILSIEKEMLEELKYKNLISNFASQKARKIDFKYKKKTLYIYIYIYIILLIFNYKKASFKIFA